MSIIRKIFILIQEKFFAIAIIVAIFTVFAGWFFLLQDIRFLYIARQATIGFVILSAIIAILIIVIIKGKEYFDKLNRELTELLKENYEVGKILVRRDIELTEANERLTALDESKSEFISIAAHQLRTPLTAIRWAFATLMEDEAGDLSMEQQKIVFSGLKSSVRMINLVGDLLNVAKIEDGKFGFEFKRQSLAPLISEAIKHISTAADDKGIMISLEISPNLPSIDIDKNKMVIALDNVFDNAIKYTAPSGKITVSASLVDESIKIVISDTGIGIPKDQIEHVFTKFFRADNALLFQTSGSGLGLYVVKNIIETHDGHIYIESLEQHGTTVTITLPINN